MTSDDKDLPRFVTKIQIEVYDQSEKNYNVNKEIRIKTAMLRSDLCDYSDAYSVVDISSQLILSQKISTQLNLTKRIMNIDKTPDPRLPNYLNEFKDCFGEIGCLRNEHHIVIDNNVPPTVNSLLKNSYFVKRKSRQ